MFVIMKDEVVNMAHVATIMLFTGANSIHFYCASNFGGDHQLASYHARKGENIREVFEKIVEGIENNKNVYLRG